MRHHAGLSGLMRLVGLATLAGWPSAVLAAEGGEHAEPNILSGDVGNVVFTLVIFTLVLGVLGKWAWKPLLTILHQREKTIRDSLETARQEREEAARLMEQYQRQLDQSRAEASAIVEEGRRDAEVLRRRIQQEARQEADQMIERARREIRLATDSAVKELYDRTADLAVHVASQIIRKELSPADHEQLVTESLVRIKEAGGPKLN